jgi:hypothetical protein
LAALVGLAWVGGLWLLGAYTPPALASWRRLARYRGLSDQRPLGERLGDRLPLLSRLQEEIDLRRLLAVAGVSQSPSAWLLRVVFVSGLTGATLLGLDEAAAVGLGALLYPPFLALAAGLAVAALSYAGLRSQARSRRRQLGRAVADSLVHVAVITYHQRLPLSEALIILARCQEDPGLHSLLADQGWRQLAEAGSPSTADLYDRIGRAYGVPMFNGLAGVLRRVTEKGLSSREAYTQLARNTYAEILAEARVAAAQAKTLIVIPMGLMIIPILLLIGAPLLAALSGIFAH